MAVWGVKEFSENTRIWRMIGAEFLGSFLLVMVGCGGIIWAENMIHVALIFGLVIAALVQGLGHLSGCHINPAVTLSFFIVGRCSILKCILYIVMQCVGAVAGMKVLVLMLPSSLVKPGMGCTTLHAEMSPMQGIFVELFATFLLVLVVHGVCDERRSDKSCAPLVIGFTVLAAHLFAIHFTGSSLNPARSFGPALVYGMWANHHIYWVGPIVGGILASVLYKLLFQLRKGDEETNSYDL